MQIALELRAQRVAGFGAGLGRVGEQLLQVLRRLAAQRFGDDRRGLLADVGDVGEPARVGEALQLLGGDARDRGRRALERLLAIRGRAPRIRSSAMRSSASTGVTPPKVPLSRPERPSYTSGPEG